MRLFDKGKEKGFSDAILDKLKSNRRRLVRVDIEVMADFANAAKIAECIELRFPSFTTPIGIMLLHCLVRMGQESLREDWELKLREV